MVLESTLDGHHQLVPWKGIGTTMSKLEIKQMDLDPKTHTTGTIVLDFDDAYTPEVECPIHGMVCAYIYHYDGGQWGPKLCFKCVADVTIDLVRKSQQRFLMTRGAPAKEEADSE